MTQRGSIIWQALLASCIIRFGQSVITIHKDAEKEICADFVCTRHSLKTETRTFVENVNNTDGHQIECKNCAHCTDSGYSVCLRAKNTADDKCLCAQEIPRGCTVSPHAGFKPVPEQQQMNICYLSSLRNPPKPVVLAESKSDLIVTIEQFRLKNYWKNMKMHNLSLYYEFPIETPQFCDGTLTTLKRQNQDGAIYLCTSTLKIDLEEEPIDSEEVLDGSTAQDDYENDLMPEVQFERDVFNGAPYVRFYYRFQVQRERQLNSQNNVVEKFTILTSDVLTYNLNPTVKQTTSQTQVYKTTTVKTTTTSSTTTSKPPPSSSTIQVIINKVNIEQRPSQQDEKKNKKEDDKPSTKDGNQKMGDKQHKNSFFDEHLNNGGQLQLIVCVSIITLGVCLLLIIATFLYRKHIGNSAKRPNGKAITKHMNGYEYKSTVQDERS